MFRKVLVPTDGSVTALKAAEAVAELIIPKSGAQVTIALVIEPLHAENTDFDDEIIERHNAKMRTNADEALAKTSRIFTQHDVEHTTKIIEGDPISVAIAREAECGNYDMIAMGSRGLGMQKNNMHYLGSVTEHVIRRVSIPVLVIPTHKEN